MNEIRPRVLVLMATYNGYPWIQEQLESILSQKSVDIYVLIRDDGSDDGTLDLLKKNYYERENIEIRYSKKSGGSAGNNFRSLYTECDLTNFDYVALSDQDDIWQPDKIKNAILVLENNAADGYSSAVEAVWPNGRKKVIQQSQRKSRNDFLYEGCGQGCTCVVRVDVFKKTSDFCKSNPELVETLHYHDWLLYLLTRVYGYRWVFDKKSYVKYRQHNKNEIGVRSGIFSAFMRFQKIRNGWLSKQIIAALKIAKTANPLFTPENARLIKKYGKINYLARILLCNHIYMYGRRRHSDRLILVLAALVGWIKVDLSCEDLN